MLKFYNNKKVVSVLLVLIMMLININTSFAREEVFLIEKTNNPNIIKVIDGTNINYIEVIKDGETIVKSENMDLLYTIRTSENKIILTDEKLRKTSVIGSFSDSIQNQNKNLNRINPYSFPTPWELRGDCVDGSTTIDKADKTIIVGVLATLVGAASGGAIAANIVTLIYNRVLAGQKDYYYRKCWHQREIAPYTKEFKTVVRMYEDSSHNKYIGQFISEHSRQ